MITFLGGLFYSRKLKSLREDLKTPPQPIDDSHDVRGTMPPPRDQHHSVLKPQRAPGPISSDTTVQPPSP
ncbi:MAG: hypothetical protein M5R36_28580 [Deltaproteobacteria bacterium]|nr:hypothetical protein [Deltaproteobacteria bacterium]